MNVCFTVLWYLNFFAKSILLFSTGTQTRQHRIDQVLGHDCNPIHKDPIANRVILRLLSAFV